MQLAKLSSVVKTDSGHQRLSDEISRLEAWFSHAVFDDFPAFPASLAAARRLGDHAVLARALCVSARGELIWGRLKAGIALADEAITVFDRLAPDEQLTVAGPHEEAWRVAANGRLKLGDVAAALPLFERAIVVAERGVEAKVPNEALFSGIPAASGLVHGLNGLGFALISMREMAGAMEVLLRALDVVDAHPETIEDVPDDIIYIVFNISMILHQEARERLSAGESADVLLVQARTLLETRARRLAERCGEVGCRVSVLGAREFLEVLSQQLLLEGKLDEALGQFQRLADSSGEDRWRGAVGERGLAETLLALGRPAEALAHAKVALAAYDLNEEVGERASVLLVLSRAYRALGQDRAALDCLDEHSLLRGRLDAIAARQYAAYMAARIGLERARAEAEAQRRIASELQALNDKLVDQATVLELQAEALSLARTAAEDANRAKSAFLANMSHELRTPLNAILGFAEMLRDGYAGAPGPAWSSYAGMVHEAGSHLLSVIGEILDLSKIEAGRVMLSVEPVDLVQMVDACGELIAPQVERGGIAFTVRRDPSIGVIQADPVRLKQILLNLLSNAVKFTEAGGRVTLSVGPGPSGFIELQVADTGIGMTAVELQVALEMFGQVESSVARKHQGSGLGLPIAVGLAELHGGSLQVQSEKGVGTRVIVTLPTRA